MKLADIKSKTKDEMIALRNDIKKQSFDLRFKLANKESIDTSKFKKLRKIVAQLNTISSTINKGA